MIALRANRKEMESLSSMKPPLSCGALMFWHQWRLQIFLSSPIDWSSKYNAYRSIARLLILHCEQDVHQWDCLMSHLLFDPCFNSPKSYCNRILRFNKITDLTVYLRRCPPCPIPFPSFYSIQMRKAQGHLGHFETFLFLWVEDAICSVCVLHIYPTGQCRRVSSVKIMPEETVLYPVLYPTTCVLLFSH